MPSYDFNLRSACFARSVLWGSIPTPPTNQHFTTTPQPTTQCFKILKQNHHLELVFVSQPNQIMQVRILNNHLISQFQRFCEELSRYSPRTVFQKILDGARKWNGPRAGLTLHRLRKNDKYFNLFLQVGSCTNNRTHQSKNANQSHCKSQKPIVRALSIQFSTTQAQALTWKSI